MPMFTVALFKVGMLWNQHRCSSAAELVKQMWYICTIDYSSVIPSNDILLCVVKWTKNIMLREISGTQKAQYNVFSL